MSEEIFDKCLTMFDTFSGVFTKVQVGRGDDAIVLDWSGKDIRLKFVFAAKSGA